jgi:hypothetical protein
MSDRPFLTARWHALAMLNWDVDPALLADRVPAGVELDTFDGRHWVSLVGFRFLDTRLRGIPIPFHRHFDEVNLRFYVRRVVGREVRRGVVFVREVVPRRAIAWVARWTYGERYVALPMRHEVALPDADDSSGHVRYAWRVGDDWCRLDAALEGAPQPAVDGSEEQFITEHYWGYARQRDGSTVEYRVEHPSWRVWRAVSSSFSGDVAPLYGNGLAAAISGPPRTTLVADGSAVSVLPGERIGAV